MTPTELNIGDLFSRRQPFMIPKYQRAYAWEEDELADFARDLAARHADRTQGHARSHFFGGVVSVQLNTADGMGRVYEVIDGQQRLATFMMFLIQLASEYDAVAQAAAERHDDLSAATADSFAKKLRDDYIFYTEVRQGQLVSEPRLVLSRADAGYFRALLTGQVAEATRQSHHRLTAAARMVKEDLIRQVASTGTPQDRLARLKTLETVALEDCRVIHLVAESKAEAYRLFEVLNDRGAGLTEGDLLRSHTLERLEASPGEQQEAEAAWDDTLADDFETAERLLRAYYTSYVGARPSKRNLFDDFVREFFPATAASTAIATRVKNIGQERIRYLQIVEGQWPYQHPTVAQWDQLRLKYLTNVLKNQLAIPLLLSASAVVQDSDFAELVYLLERFVFRFITICRGKPSLVESVIFPMARDLRQGGFTDWSELRAKLATLSTNHASDDLFRANLLDRLRYTRGSNPVLKYFLLTIEDHLHWSEAGSTGEPEPDRTTIVDAGACWIEHIYPQSAEAVDQEMEPIKHTLANLTLWAPNDNRAAANSTFADKRACYGLSKLGITRELALLPDWNHEAAQRRRETLMRRALAVYQI